MSNISLGPKAFFQTSKEKIISDKKEVSVRIILDSGSQRSYILKSLAEEMAYIPVRNETLVHSLFGGVKSQKFEHTCYKVRLRGAQNNFACNFEELDQLSVCNDVTPVNAGPWMKKLQEMNITLTDISEKSQSDQVLIGADLFGKILTDMAPAGFFLFHRLKGILKGLRFSDIAQIQQRMTTVLRAIPKEAFANSFQQLYNR
ncbi:hypothetical protein AVEN_118136-1 [Araneus ventricosus]|uniref:Uncharacterized protein n=1 Tax=Araneus ventricosus TaxID=182803 RepID=A0A4Y2NSG2_ARAVE|nr:hypothetical protein AVEN_118136-1 [Araneus ventricosus]